MGKVAIIIGFNSLSGKLIERFFIECGMKPAQKSKYNSISPLEIDNVLNKLNDTKEILSIDVNNNLINMSFISKNKSNNKRKKKSIEDKNHLVWDNLALNLFLANLEQPFWGWSDDNALNLVEYWYKINPKIKFILVYDRPEDIFFNNNIDKIKHIDKSWLQTEFSNWIKYAKRVLELIKRYPNNCILINKKQVLDFPDDSIEKLFNKLGVSINRSKNNKLSNNLTHSITENNIFKLLTERMITSNQELKLLYSQLQELSFLPYKYSDEYDDSILLSIDSWNDILEYFYGDNSKDNLQEKILEQEKNKEVILKRYNLLLEDNQALLNQLHLVQEKFEDLFLENKKLKSKLNPALLGAEKRIRQQLRYRLGFQMIKSSKSILGILSMPFSLIRVYCEYKIDRMKNREKLPSISSYQDYYQAEKMKNHLSYKLGGVFLDNFKLPFKWFFLPKEIINTIRVFRKEKNKTS
ncbi:hypothetical protein CEP45_04405 [Mergibacter septicus]|uniref:hypothetical protein n=1 Tax=Mergibacter septicus TaxID=221402 RepID=UPI001C73FB70|nr:hypothetical protein [Mergibacter septicus]QDJ13139.1 hypothetical protein CEP45_04405 [Mergibacter septicus]